MRELTKDIDLRGHRYQVGKMTATDGCWVAMQIFTKVMPGMLENKVGVTGLPSGRSDMSEQEFHNIQNHCLAVCKRFTVVGDVPVAEPVMRGERFAFKDLEHDVLTVMGLTAHALIFNVLEFFQGDGLKEILASFPDTPQSNPSL